MPRSLEQIEVEQGHVGCTLPHDECGKQHEPDGHGESRLGRPDAPARPAHAEHEQSHAASCSERPEQVNSGGAAGRGSAGSSRQEATKSATPTGAFTKKTSRQLTLDEQAPDDRAGCEAGGGDGTVHAERVAAVLFIGPARDEQREPRGSEEGGAETLDSPRREQESRLDRKPPGGAREDEDAEADPVQPRPPEHVRQTTAEQEHTAERDGVCAHQPLQRGRRDMQTVLDRR